MTTVQLNFQGCQTWQVLHKILKDTFNLPDYYGENWDALWDCLRYEWIGAGSVTVEVTGFQSMNEELKDYCIPMLEIFEDVHRDTPNVTFKMLS